MDEMVYPLRINKYLAHMKHCTRRDADTYIAAGKVLVEEAGGKVFNLTGAEWSGEKGVVAGNSALCKKLLSLVK